MDPQEFFVAVDSAVAEFAGSLDEIDRDYQGRTLDEVPEDEVAWVDFVWELEAEILGEYFEAWDGYIERLEGLRAPEGVPGAGEGFEEGLPEYFESGIIAAEQSALDANRSYLETRYSLDDRVAFVKDGGRSLPEEERDRQRTAGEALVDTQHVVDDEWEILGDAAEELGFPIDEAVELRTDQLTDFLPFRAARALDLERPGFGS